MSSRKFALTLVAVLGVLAGCADKGDGRGGAGPSGSGKASSATQTCEWPMAGHDPSRSGRQPCGSRLDAKTVDQLELKWFVATSDVTSATPAVGDGVAFVGDWAGQATAIELDTGSVKWTADLSDPTPLVYAGQITSTPAITDAGKDQLVVYASGPRVIALDRSDGSVVWKRDVGDHDPSDPNDPTEIEGSPVVVGGKDPRVIVGFDVHNTPNHAAGVAMLDAATGEVVWQWVPDEGRKGCADVWGAPAVDVEHGQVFVGTSNCPGSPAAWGPASEAIVALDLDSGDLQWTFQPHPPNNDDLDFAGAPNLFRIGDTDVVGLGNKDGHYYVVDRKSGTKVWESSPTGPTITAKGSNFSTGGIVGPAAVAKDGTIVIASAGDDRPFLHGIDSRSGRIRWQQNVADASYAGVTTVNDIAFAGGNDFTLRAVRTSDGKVVWDHEMKSVVAGAPAIVSDRVVAVSGLREPGSATKATSSGVYLFGFPDDSVSSITGLTSTTAAPTGGIRLAPSPQSCVDSVCPIGFQFKEPPPGRTPSIEARIDTDPFGLTIDATGLGQPIEWLDPDGPNVAAGATVFGAVLSVSDDNPLSAGVICILDANGHCKVSNIPQRSTSYNRLTILALKDASTGPTLADGYDRLVVTHSFDPALTEVPR